MGTILQGQDTGLHQQFWTKLTATANTYALNQLWLARISQQDIKNVISLIKTNLPYYEPNWNINSDIDILSKNTWFLGDGTYNLLVRSVTFPGDSIETERVGVSHSGNIKGLIGTQRSDMPNVNIVFMETNQSFADLVLRPWAILAGHLSLHYVGTPNIKMPEIQLVCYQKVSADKPLKIRKTIRLKGVVPINIDNEEYNYTGDKIIDRTINFAYTKYTIDANVGTDYEGLLMEQMWYNKTASQSLHPPQDMTHPNEIQAVKLPTRISVNSTPIGGANRSGDIDIIIPVMSRFDMQQKKELSLLDQAHNLMDTVEGAFNTVKGKINNVRNSVGRIVSIIPGKTGQKIQNAVNGVFNDAQSKLNNVGQVIGTGQRVVHTADEVVNLTRELTTLGNANTQNQVPSNTPSVPPTSNNNTLNVNNSMSIPKLTTLPGNIGLNSTEGSLSKTLGTMQSTTIQTGRSLDYPDVVQIAKEEAGIVT